jgi:transcriptional regulator with XRE-family HTH domain
MKLSDIIITPLQCRLARKALGWNSRDLAANALIGSATVERFESGQTRPIAATVAAMRRAFESEGIEFLGGNGLRVNRREVA